MKLNSEIGTVISFGSTVNLAASLGMLDQKVLLIDLDPQASCSFWYGIKKQGQGLLEMFIKERGAREVVLNK
ncbi:MAG: hypothetical protein S4CHLAM6_13900 [Chlamydiae bacterium]|nr:hypothetical protein [Chlamydiota bacterium]